MQQALYAPLVRNKILILSRGLNKSLTTNTKAKNIRTKNIRTKNVITFQPPWYYKMHNNLFCLLLKNLIETPVYVYQTIFVACKLWSLKSQW